MDYKAINRKMAYYNENKRLIPNEVLQNYEASFRISYTHNSTAIEGNTLSLIETKLLLENGLSPNGKTMREIYETINHDKAYSYVKKCIFDGKTLDKNIVKEIHAILMENIMVGGIYRNVDVYIIGARHTPPSPNEAYKQLEFFYSDMLEKKNNLHIIDFAAWTHAEFVKIHPFVDGNGRTSRLLMNYQLMAADWLPVDISNKHRLEYFETLEAYACENNLEMFSSLITKLTEEKLDKYITAIEQSKQSDNIDEDEEDMEI
jgi:Fic family protein